MVVWVQLGELQVFEFYVWLVIVGELYLQGYVYEWVVFLQLWQVFQQLGGGFVCYFVGVVGLYLYVGVCQVQGVGGFDDCLVWGVVVVGGVEFLLLFGVGFDEVLVVVDGCQCVVQVEDVEGFIVYGFVLGFFCLFGLGIF